MNIAPETLKSIKREWNKGGPEDRTNATEWATSLGLKLDAQGNPITAPMAAPVVSEIDLSPRLAAPTPKEGDAVRGDTPAAIDFLKRWSALTGTSPVLTAIRPDLQDGAPGKIVSKAFKPDSNGEVDYGAVTRWIDERQSNANLYFQVNQRVETATLKTKASMDEIDSIVAWHVDVDVWVREDQEAGIARILKTFEDPTKAKHPPTIITSSGGGAQAFWVGTSRLKNEGKTPDERRAIANRFAGHNRAIERDCDGDHCHNLDRIMRLAGTVNVPTAIKLKKGRKPALARVVKFDPTCVYDLASFENMPDKTKSAESATVDSSTPKPDDRRAKVAPSGQEIRVTDIEDARLKKLSEHGKRLMVHGRDADNPGEDQSDSGPLFGFLKSCIRADFSDVLMTVIVTDKRWPISAHILKQSNATAATQRQIAKARKAVAKDDGNTKAMRAALFAELNVDNFVIGNVGGHARIGTMVHQHGRDVLSLTTVSDFGVRHSQPMLDCAWAGRPRPLGEVWAKSAERRFYSGVTFDPKGPAVTEDGKLNMWRGFGVEPKKGSWKRLRKHIWENVAQRDRAAFKYIIRWLAWSVQNPNKPAEVVLAFIGEQGTGKGLIGRTHNNFYGPQHSRHVSDIEEVTGRFNSSLQDCCALFLDEVYLPKGGGHRGNLFRMITDPTLAIERKGVDRDTDWPNCLHIIAVGNHDRFAIERGDRRFALFEVSEAHKDDRQYFTPVYAELESGGKAAMLFDLLRLKLGDWHPNPAPKTEAHRRQRALNLEPAEVLVERLLQDQCLPGASDQRPDWCPSHGTPGGALGLKDKAMLGEIDRRLPNIGVKAIDLELVRYGAMAKQDSTGNRRGWQFASPGDCRARWEKRHGAWAWENETHDQWGHGHADLPF